MAATIAAIIIVDYNRGTLIVNTTMARPAALAAAMPRVGDWTIVDIVNSETLPATADMVRWADMALLATHLNIAKYITAYPGSKHPAALAVSFLGPVPRAIALWRIRI
jgi:hypothetical protein